MRATFAVFSEFIESFIGRLILFLFSWALFHHLIGGLRHIILDAGYGLDAPLRDQLAWANFDRRFRVYDGGVGHRLRRPVREHRDGR